MKFLRKYWNFIFVILLSLTPIIWFLGRKNILIDGVDTNFPLDPIVWFQRRFFVWQGVSNAGGDFSASTAGTFFHLLQVIPYKFGLNLQITEIFNLIFWFCLIVGGSFLFSRLIFPQKKMPQIIFVSLYSLNLYLFNTWENVKVANLALISAIPLGLSVLILLKENKIKRPLAAVYSIFIGIILSGAGINPAYILCFYLIIFIFLVCEILVDFGDFSSIKKQVVNFIILSGIVFLINLFWIIPSLNFIFGSITATNSISSLGFTNWVDSLSQNTSLVNVIRMQGAWDWYSFDSITHLPLYIPYALKYFDNPFFIFFSFLIPSLALLGYIFKKRNFNLLYVFFGVLLVLGIFLTAGTHEPTGSLFRILVNHLPFFSLFRSPWYIFAPLVGLSIAGLVGLFFNNLNNKFSFVVGTLFLGGLLIYSYPLLLGRIFRPGVDGGFFVNFPAYVFQTENYLAKDSDQGRILSFPDDSIEKFNWGYTGVDSILNLFSDKEVIFNGLNESQPSVSQIVSEIYTGLKKGEISKIDKLANSLSIDRVFAKYDQVSLSPDLPQEIKNNLITKFGNWAIYKLTDLNPKITLGSCCTLSFPYEDSSKNLSLLDKDQILINPQDKLLKSGNGLLEKSSIIIKTKNSQLADFIDMDSGLSNIKSRLVKRDLNSVNFEFEVREGSNYRPILEKYNIAAFDILDQNKLDVFIDGKETTLTLLNSDDSYLYFSPIFVDSGKHTLTIKLKNRNIIDLNNYTTLGDGVFSFNNGMFDLFNQSDKDVYVNLKVKDFDIHSYYLVQLSYKQTYGNNAALLMDQRTKSTLFKDQTERMPNYPDWSNFSFYYHPVETASDLTVGLSAPQTKDPLGTKVSYRDLSVYKVFSNDLFLKKDSATEENLGSVKFAKNSPVLYSGEVKGIKGPHVILFNENYSPSWELVIEGVKPTKVSHFTGNYYANAWYIDGIEGDYKFKIYYKPQNFADAGYLISGLTFVLVFLVLLKNLWRKK